MGAGLSKKQRYNKIYSYIRTKHFIDTMYINHNLRRFIIKGIVCYFKTEEGEYKETFYKWYFASNGECYAELITFNSHKAKELLK